MGYRDPETQRQYQREWMSARRAAWFEGKSCADCGSASELNVDHSDPRKKITHRVWSWAAPRREAELDKCVVRCTPCHKRKTRANRDFGPSKVNADQVRQIRDTYRQGGVRQVDLAAAYGLSQQEISLIVREERWEDVQ